MDIAEVVKILTAGYPPQVWYVPSILLFILAVTSLVDARTGRVPDLPIIVGVMGGIGCLAWFFGWLPAGERLLYAIAAVLGLKFVNNFYYKLFKQDAFGFGDAKWTGLAVVAFGIVPVLWAWAVGAWLGLMWMALRWGCRWIARAQGQAGYVHFAPFLLLGLLATLFKAWLLPFLHLPIIGGV
jgi:prepilin signal peptidase PulO-like enzyme (type II secretory pathway)